MEKGLAISDALKLIKKKRDINARYFITVLNANKRSIELQNNIFPYTDLCIEFVGLDSSSCLDKLKSIKVKQFDIEVTGTPKEIIPVLQVSPTYTVEYFNNEKDTDFEIIQSSEAAYRL